MPRRKPATRKQLVLSVVLGSLLSFMFVLSVRVATLPAQLLDDPILRGEQESTRDMFRSSMLAMYHLDSPYWMLGFVFGAILFSWIILLVIRRAI